MFFLLFRRFLLGVGILGCLGRFLFSAWFIPTDRVIYIGVFNGLSLWIRKNELRRFAVFTFVKGVMLRPPIVLFKLFGGDPYPPFTECTLGLYWQFLLKNLEVRGLNVESYFSEYFELKIKSAYLKALYEVRDLLQSGYDKAKLLEWLDEKISSLQEEIAEEISGY